jgi:hypothetical protein
MKEMEMRKMAFRFKRTVKDKGGAYYAIYVDRKGRLYIAGMGMGISGAYNFRKAYGDVLDEKTAKELIERGRMRELGEYIDIIEDCDCGTCELIIDNELKEYLQQEQ